MSWFLETKDTLVFLSQTLFAWIVLEDFGGPSLLKVYCDYPWLGFGGPFELDWLESILSHLKPCPDVFWCPSSWKNLVSNPYSLNLQNYHCFIDTKYSAINPKQKSSIRKLTHRIRITYRSFTVLEVLYPLTKKCAIIREK